MAFVCAENGCTKSYAHIGGLQRHFREKHTDTVHKCPKCNYETNRVSNLKTHDEAAHSDEWKYACAHDGCTKKFKTKSNLSIHKRGVHATEKKYVCEECRKKYKTREGLNLHKQNKHPTSEVKLKCDEYEYETYTQQYLTVHKRRHKKEKPHICDVPQCTGKFKTKRELRDHQKVHNDERPHACDQCTAKFKRRYELVEHVKSHTNARAYKCDYQGCTASFNSRCTLTKHKKAHLGIKDKQCDLCDGKFRDNYALERHKKSHSTTRAFSCEICASTFKRKDTLDHHTKHVHTKSGQKHRKTSEDHLAISLKNANIQFDRELMVDFKCSLPERAQQFARIDFVIYKEDKIFLLENDEFQHSHYEVSCETRRMTDVYSSLVLEEKFQGNKIVWIRYNPDAFKINGQTTRITKKDRDQKLFDLLDNFQTEMNMAIIYMFYDCELDEEGEHTPAIFDDADYNVELKDVVVTVV